MTNPNNSPKRGKVFEEDEVGVMEAKPRLQNATASTAVAST
jgi:hypothetical protein